MEASEKTRQAIAAANAKAQEHRKHLRVLGLAGAAAAGIVAIAMIGYYTFRKPPLARLNADTATLARFVTTETFLSLPLERQEPYMKVLSEREATHDLQAAYTNGKISEDEYRNARQEAWYWQQIKRSEKWAALPTPEAKIGYLNELIEKKAREDHPASILPDVPKLEKPTSPLDRAPKVGKKPKPASPPGESLGIRRDDSYERIRINRWPKEPRDRYLAFQRAYKDQKKVYEAAMAIKAATRPSATAGK